MIEFQLGQKNEDLILKIYFLLLFFGPGSCFFHSVSDIYIKCIQLANRKKDRVTVIEYCLYFCELFATLVKLYI